MSKEIWVNDNVCLERVSRWITVKTNYNPNKRNSLWSYVTDKNGYHTTSDNFNAKSDLYLDYFTFNGRNYAIEQFINCGFKGYEWEEKDGWHRVGYYDAEQIFNSLLIECDEYGEKVRLYREIPVLPF